MLPLVKTTVLNNSARVFSIGYDNNAVVENNVITADLVSSDAREGDWPGALGVWHVDNSTVESNTGGYMGAYVVANSTITRNYASSDYVNEVERVIVEGNKGAQQTALSFSCSSHADVLRFAQRITRSS